MPKNSDYTFTKNFNELNSKDANIAGGKGASLGELTASGASVPPGFVVITLAWQTFIEQTQLNNILANELNKLTSKNAKQISEKIQKSIHDEIIPSEISNEILTRFDDLGLELVSVRSSATAEDGSTNAWAGQLDTFLNIKKENVIENIKMCFASLFTERSLLYALNANIHPVEVGVAVVVQKMVDAKAAGVGFSVHPTTQEDNVMLLQSAFGLGEAVVSGTVTPDSWVINKNDAKVLDKVIANKKQALKPNKQGIPEWVELTSEAEKPSLTDEQAHEYGKMLAKIEKHYGHPVDTEWAIENDKFYLLQARPITTLSADYKKEIYNTKKDWQALYKRPWNLFACTLFHRNLKNTAALLQAKTPSALLIQLQHELIEICLVKNELDGLDTHAKSFVEKDPKHAIKLLTRGIEIAEQVSQWEKEDAVPFNNIEDMAVYMKEAVTTTVQLPYLIVDMFSDQELSADIQTVEELAEKLRSTSSYPWFTDVLTPKLVKKRADELGLHDVENPLDVLTFEEALSGNVEMNKVHERIEAIRQGKMFVCEFDEQDKIQYLDQTAFLISRIQGARLPEVFDDDEMRGAAAFPGIIEGIARVVIHPDDDVEFNEGDILVSVNANPSFMPFIQKASALVTEEGGPACHAGIISRELEKPCIMSVPQVTKRIQSGQKIKVDAFEQVITIIE